MTATPYAGWSGFRWSGLVLIGTDPYGREHSVGEIVTRRGDPTTVVVCDPMEGERALLEQPSCGTVRAARLQVHGLMARLGAHIGVEPRALQVAAYVARYPGCTAAEVAGHLQTSIAATYKALQQAVRVGLVMRVGNRNTTRYRPVSTHPALPPPGAASSPEEPSARSAADGPCREPMIPVPDATGSASSSVEEPAPPAAAHPAPSAPRGAHEADHRVGRGPEGSGDAGGHRHADPWAGRVDPGDGGAGGQVGAGAARRARSRPLGDCQDGAPDVRDGERVAAAGAGGAHATLSDTCPPPPALTSRLVSGFCSAATAPEGGGSGGQEVPGAPPPPSQGPEGAQPAPRGGTGDVWAELIGLVVAEHPDLQALVPMMRERRRLGIERYGQPLRRGDGRDELRDLVEELADGAAYAVRLGRVELALRLLRDVREVTR